MLHFNKIQTNNALTAENNYLKLIYNRFGGMFVILLQGLNFLYNILIVF